MEHWPAQVMRHRGAALLVDAIESREPQRLCCTSRGDGPWPWPRMLEGAAQTAGLLAGLQPGGPFGGIVAQYRNVEVATREHPGPLRFVATFERRVLHFWRCRVEVRDRDGEVLLTGSVTIAAPPAPESAA
jgi:hypothetical protein